MPLRRTLIHCHIKEQSGCFLGDKETHMEKKKKKLCNPFLRADSPLVSYILSMLRTEIIFTPAMAKSIMYLTNH